MSIILVSDLTHAVLALLSIEVDRGAALESGYIIWLIGSIFNDQLELELLTKIFTIVNASFQ